VNAALRVAAMVLACAASLGAAATELRSFGPTTLAQVKREHAGKPFVLALWSVHCAPCLEEMAVWRELRARYPSVPIVLVAADVPDERERVQRFLAKNDPGSVEAFVFEDEFEERIRFGIDPRWRGELPRAYFFGADHRPDVKSGLPERAWLDRWFTAASR
jgi:thiol-disulfide isomerase/thioredoxin